MANSSLSPGLLDRVCASCLFDPACSATNSSIESVRISRRFLPPNLQACASLVNPLPLHLSQTRAFSIPFPLHLPQTAALNDLAESPNGAFTRSCAAPRT